MIDTAMRRLAEYAMIMESLDRQVELWNEGDLKKRRRAFDKMENALRERSRVLLNTVQEGSTEEMTYRELIAALDDILKTQKVIASLRDAILKTDIESEVNIVAIDIVANLLHDEQRSLLGRSFALIGEDIQEGRKNR